MKPEYKKYNKEIVEKFYRFKQEMAKYQETLPDEYILSEDYDGLIPACLIVFIRQSVGEEVVIPFLIDLLYTANKKDMEDKMLGRQQRDRFNRIRKEKIKEEK